MLKKIYLFTVFVFTILSILSTMYVVETIRVGDELEYSFKILFEYKLYAPKFVLGEDLKYFFVECFITWEINGIMVYQIDEIDDESISIKVRYRDIEINYFIKCNDTEIESSRRRDLEESLRIIRDELLKQEFSFEIPLMFRFNETVSTVPLPYRPPIAFPMEPYIGVPDKWFNYTVVETTYRNKPCLLIETWIELNQSKHGISYYVRSQRTVLKARSQTYVDISGVIIYYFVIESSVENNIEVSIDASPWRTVSEFFKLKAESELRNMDEIVEEYKIVNLELRFRENKGSILLSGYNTRLNNYRVDGRKLVLNISGSGLGGILVNITKDTTLQNIYIDGRITSYIKEEFKDYIIVRVPITYSNRIVEIEFGEEIVEVKQIEFEKPLYETFLILSIIVIIIAVPVALVIYILKRLKKI